MAPIVFEMEVHCFGCARKIRKALKDMSGVESVFASVDTQQVVVDGPADAEALKDLLEATMRRPVAIVSDGQDAPAEEEEEEAPAAAPTPPPETAPEPEAPAGPSMGYVYNDSPPWFSDENPNACSVQ